MAEKVVSGLKYTGNAEEVKPRFQLIVDVFEDGSQKLDVLSEREIKVEEILGAACLLLSELVANTAIDRVSQMMMVADETEL